MYGHQLSAKPVHKQLLSNVGEPPWPQFRDSGVKLFTFPFELHDVAPDAQGVPASVPARESVLYPFDFCQDTLGTWSTGGRKGEYALLKIMNRSLDISFRHFNLD